MRVRSVILARSIQRTKPLAGTIGYLPDIVQKIKIKYGFLTAPRDEDLVVSDPPKGAVFQHGRLLTENGRQIIINQFTVFNDGLVADASSSTEDTDGFLDDVIAWAKKEFPKAEVYGPRYYVSQMEIQMDTPLESYAPRFVPIGDKVTSLLNTYGIPVSRYEVTGIQVNFDQLGKLPPQPGMFAIERRLNIPYSDNVWFTQAPLKTADHETLLKGLENGGAAESG